LRDKGPGRGLDPRVCRKGKNKNYKWWWLNEETGYMKSAAITQQQKL